MAVKTITIDLEAYEALSQHRGRGESFSEVIKSHFGRQRTGRDLKRTLERVHLSEATIDRIDDVVRARRRSRVRSLRP